MGRVERIRMRMMMMGVLRMKTLTCCSHSNFEGEFDEDEGD